MKEKIEEIAKNIGGNVSEKKGTIIVDALIAERKVFLTKKKLIYTFKVKIDNEAKTVKFTEMLKESGLGFSAGGGDFDTPGFGFKKETYNTTSGAREGTIEESSKLFGKDYKYNFDYSKVRKEVEAVAKEKGYTFEYFVLPIGF